MKITIKGYVLIEKLQNQRARCLKKLEEANLFLTEHSKIHNKELHEFKELKSCNFELQVETLKIQINNSMFSTDAAIDVINKELEYKLTMKEYLHFYVESFADAIIFPLLATNNLDEQITWPSLTKTN